MSDTQGTVPGSVWPLHARAERGRALLEGLLSAMGLSPQVMVRGKEEEPLPSDLPPITLDIGGEDLGILIGWRGETLQALQIVLDLMLGEEDRAAGRVIVDVEHYRARREAQAADLARRTAERVKTTGQRHMLDPMRGYERRAIHLALHDDPELRTESTGRDPARRVVISPAGAAAERSG